MVERKSTERHPRGAATKKKRAVGRVVTWLLLLFSAPAVLAADGVLEINQTCAVETGCFAGDTPGFPVTIGAPGSYKLTSSLVIPTTQLGGVEINSSRTTLDLGGFEVRGPNDCIGTPPSASVTCTATTGGTGILSTATVVEVRNGIVVGMGDYGIWLGVMSVISDVRVLDNGTTGIRVDSGSSVTRASVLQNGRFGINVGSGSTVMDSQVYRNGSGGIASGDGSVVRGNSVDSNSGSGIQSSASVIRDNAFHNNGGNGILAVTGSVIQSNSVRGNSAAGLELSPDSGYGGNVITGNLTRGVNLGQNLGGNYCAGTNVSSSACP